MKSLFPVTLSLLLLCIFLPAATALNQTGTQVSLSDKTQAENGPSGEQKPSNEKARSVDPPLTQEQKQLLKNTITKHYENYKLWANVLTFIHFFCVIMALVLNTLIIAIAKLDTFKKKPFLGMGQGTAIAISSALAAVLIGITVAGKTADNLSANRTAKNRMEQLLLEIEAPGATYNGITEKIAKINSDREERFIK